jgi:hypothetical protein
MNFSCNAQQHKTQHTLLIVFDCFFLLFRDETSHLYRNDARVCGEKSKEKMSRKMQDINAPKRLVFCDFAKTNYQSTKNTGVLSGPCPCPYVPKKNWWTLKPAFFKNMTCTNPTQARSFEAKITF